MNDDKPIQLNLNNGCINENKQDGLNPKQMICSQHKRKIEFICQFKVCQQRFLCPMCKGQHENHLSCVESIDKYLDEMIEDEKGLYLQRKQMVEERATQMRSIVKRISQSLEQFQIDELADLQNQFEDVTLRSQQDKYQFVKDFCNEEFDKIQLNKDANYQKIYESAQKVLNFIKRKEYNLQKLIGIVIKQDNLFDMIDTYNRSSKQNTHRNQNIHEDQINISALQNNIQHNQQNNSNNQLNIQYFDNQNLENNLPNIQNNLVNIDNNEDNIDSNPNMIDYDSNILQNNFQNILQNIQHNQNNIQVNEINHNNIRQNYSQVNNQREVGMDLFRIGDVEENNYEVIIGNRGQEGDLVLQFEIDESELLSDPSYSNEVESNRSITALLKLNNSIIVFNDQKIIYYYNFILRKILYKFELNRNANIHKIIKLNDKKIAVLLSRKFTQNFIIPGLIMITIHYEVYILEININQIKKHRIFAQQNGLEIKDIIAVKNSQFIAIVQESKSILLINQTNGKQVAQYTSDADSVDQFEGIFSCTFLNNIRIDGILYKSLIAVNLIDGSYGLWDFINNKYVLKKTFSSILGLDYKFSTCVNIQQLSTQNHQNQQMKERRNNIMKEREQNQVKRNLSRFQKLDKKEEDDDQIFGKKGYKQEQQKDEQEQTCLIVIKGDRNETYFQSDFNGQLEIKMNHRLMDYFDLFYNKSAIPFYFNNTLFFYDFKQKQRLKTISINTKYQNSPTYKYEDPLNILHYFNKQLDLNNNNSTRYQAFQHTRRQNNQFQNTFNETPYGNQRNFFTNSEHSSLLFSNNYNLNQRNLDQINLNRNHQFNQEQRPNISCFTNMNDNENTQKDSNYKNISKQKQSQEDEQSEDKSESSIVSRKQQQSQTNQQQSQQYEQYQSQMQQSQQQRKMSFSQIWDQQLIQFNQNQRNIQPIEFQQNGRRDNQQTNLNSQNNNDHSIFQNKNQFNQSVQQNNDKLFNVCPIGVINHFDFIVVVFPNGIIQYIK